MWGRSSCWNPVGWTRKFSCWHWRGCCWIPCPPCPCPVYWTYPTEWLVLHRSLRGVLPDILLGELWLQQWGCSRYVRASALSSSQKTPLVVLHSLQLPSVLFELRGWPNLLYVELLSFSDRRNQSHHSARWGPFPSKPSRPFTIFLETWRFSRAFYLWRCYNYANAMSDNIGGW